jgi:dolichyl-phosphate-mannose-protein mannosyltransferase
MNRLARSVAPPRISRISRILSATLGYRIGLAPAALVVTLVASINFLGGLGKPPAPIWDESYYLTAAQRYEQRIAQFASHPPLGLALIAAGDAALHPNRHIDTRRIGWDKKIAGDQLPRGYSFAGVRLASGIFGVLGALAFFALMFVLTRSALAALAFSNLYLFENAFIVHFRAAQLDGFQIAFVLAALLCFAVSAQRGPRSSPLLELLYGISCGLAIMVKVNALTLGLLGVLLVARRIQLGWHTGARARLFLAGLRDGAVMAGGCFAAMAAVLTFHVVFNRVPPVAGSPAGTKDLSFLSGAYRAYLHHRRPLSPRVLLAAGRDYVSFMADDFEGIARTDPNGSTPIEWPLHRGTINYRWDSTDGRTAYVQLTGNLFNWMLGLAGLLGSAAWLIVARTRRWPTDHPERRALMGMLILQYVAFMAVHIYIGEQRVMYLYHYFIGLLLTFCLVPLLAADAAEHWPALRERQVPLLAAMSVLTWACFIFYAPLTFHWYLTHGQCEWRNVLQHVVNCQ